jgi:hypothetical protein
MFLLVLRKRVIGMKKIKLIQLEEDDFFDELSEEGFLIHPDLKKEFLPA